MQKDTATTRTVVKHIALLQAVVYQDILEQGPATIIGALRGATCISGLLNVTFFDTSTSVTLALFSRNSTLSFSSGTSDYWTSVAKCFVDIANPLCTFNSSPLLSNAPDYFVAVIPTVTTSDSDATNSLSSALGGIYTARYQGLTAGDGALYDVCPVLVMPVCMARFLLREALIPSSSWCVACVTQHTQLC